MTQPVLLMQWERPSGVSVRRLEDGGGTHIMVTLVSRYGTALGDLYEAVVRRRAPDFYVVTELKCSRVYAPDIKARCYASEAEAIEDLDEMFSAADAAARLGAP